MADWNARYQHAASARQQNQLSKAGHLLFDRRDAYSYNPSADKHPISFRDRNEQVCDEVRTTVFGVIDLRVPSAWDTRLAGRTSEHDAGRLRAILSSVAERYVVGGARSCAGR